MVDAGKVALYLRWMLEEIGIIMDAPTDHQFLADNQGAVRLANAQQPTRRTQHVEVKHFIILPARGGAGGSLNSMTFDLRYFAIAT